MKICQKNRDDHWVDHDDGSENACREFFASAFNIQVILSDLAALPRTMASIAIQSDIEHAIVHDLT